MPEQRILFIEDEPTTREIVTYVLREEGYEVDSVGSASAALTCLQSLVYALVIADWQLPDGDGIYLADRAVTLGAQTLIVTGHLADLPPGVANRHALLTKPVNPTGLIGWVRTLIGKPRTTA
jgi:DNA-binding response OmpR family regulator